MLVTLMLKPFKIEGKRLLEINFHCGYGQNLASFQKDP